MTDTPLSFRADLAAWASENLPNCIGVDHCMKACPVVDPSLTIADLNDATHPDTPLAGAAFALTRDCIQCGRCDTVCPTAAGRSVMLLAMKEKMADRGLSPATHRRYFALKGYDKSPFRRAAFAALTKIKWRLTDREKSARIAPHLGKERLRKAEHLIYLGCYAYTGEASAHQTVAIADRAGLDYDVLAGLESCCGWPSLLAGRTDEADRYHAKLAERIAEADPSFVVSGCAECYSSLRIVKERYGMRFAPLTTPQWILGFVDRLNVRKDSAKVTLHDSCHVVRKAGMPEPVRELLAKMVDLTEMDRSGANENWCCGYWGLGANRDQIADIHASRYEEARATGAPVMMVECVSCLESFSQSVGGAGVTVRDVVDLVFERMERP